jgi:hypothetical protein
LRLTLSICRNARLCDAEKRPLPPTAFMGR